MGSTGRFERLLAEDAADDFPEAEEDILRLMSLRVARSASETWGKEDERRGR